MEKRYDPYVKRYITKDDYIQECLGGLPCPIMLEEQWEKLPLHPEEKTAIEIATMQHIQRVRQLLIDAANELIHRAAVHDRTKLESPEKEIFEEYTSKLAGCTYGSDEYKECLEKMKPALEHHYANNSHHPEHYENGMNGFDLFDLIEMFFDWKAATERHNDGDIYNSIYLNKSRFGYDDMMESIFKNTAERLNY